MKKTLLALSLMAGVFTASGVKKVLDHTDFDRWEKVTNHSLSNNGLWASYAVNPQEGDGTLYFYNTAKGNKIEIRRGYRPSFTADGNWAFALIKPYYEATRNAKIAKKKDFDLPQDSLAIINLKTGKVSRVGHVISYKAGREGGQSVAWLSCDTTLIKPKALKNKKVGRPLVVRNLSNDSLRVINWVSDYGFSRNGDHLSFNLKKSDTDTLATNGVGVLDLHSFSYTLIDRDKEFYTLPVFNEDASQVAYIASLDTVKTGTKRASLYLSDIKSGNHDPREIKIDHFKTEDKRGEELLLNQYSQPKFSYNGKRLIVGVAPYVAPDDTTIVSFESPTLDIWRWDAPYTPPQENERKKDLREQTFPVAVDLASGRQVLVTSNPFARVMPANRWDADWVLISDHSEHGRERQWDYQYPVSLRLKNISTGETRDIATVPNELCRISPMGKYVVWYADRQYFSYDVATGAIHEISTKVPYPLWMEDQDTPGHLRDPYGIMGWSENDGRMMVYDKYDVWSLDPKGESEPLCLTAGEGRKTDMRIRNIQTDPDFRFFKNNERLVMSLFNYKDKRNGLASMTYTGKAVAPKVDFLDEYTFTQLAKAKDAPEYSWIQGNFQTSPNVYVSAGLNPSKTVRVSDSNPQMADYSWGKAQLFTWYTYQGHPAEGVLYLPDDFDPDKSYPMISYFYETYTEDLYRHYDMEPSWSWINFPFYVSRGYVIFVPDIHYSPGIPGENAYDYVCSGVEAVCKAYPNVDKKRVGIDGQSWGGYQTAFLVTRTDKIACAGSGAPVANMTSAFGGIRWGTGDSRQAQYEVGQSRIGRNLWEAPELYIANSPVFHADRVQTPLLIMANDADGAVPWYQGIEMFMALRRLGKPVWMLQYNGEAHNLKERRNRKDITKRLQQFFDHYLKGDPMPRWMEEGIPAIRKGQDFGY